MQPLMILAARRHVPGQALAGEGGSVKRGGALHHHAVDGDLLPGLDHNDGTHGHLVRVHPLQVPVPLHVGVVGADVHELGDVPAALAHGVGLEPLADLVEQHDGHGLGVVPLPSYRARAMAPTVATAMRKHSSNTCRRAMPRTAFSRMS